MVPLQSLWLNVACSSWNSLYWDKASTRIGTRQVQELWQVNHERLAVMSFPGLTSKVNGMQHMIWWSQSLGPQSATGDSWISFSHLMACGTFWVLVLSFVFKTKEALWSTSLCLLSLHCSPTGSGCNSYTLLSSQHYLFSYSSLKNTLFKHVPFC